MTNIDRQIDKAGEIEARFTDIRGEIKTISESVLALSEILGVATDELYELRTGLEDQPTPLEENMKEMGAQNDK